MRTFFISSVREIRSSFGRYLAILVITALGVGFFAGLCACRPSLTDTLGEYFEEQNFCDYRILSSVGFPKDCAGSFTTDTRISAAEGALYGDILITGDGNDIAVRFHSVTESVCIPDLVSGRMPEADNECVVDSDYFGEDIIGQTIAISGDNSEEAKDVLRVSSFTVVGTVRTPLYISADRGTTTLGNGKTEAFVFVSESCFTADYFTEIYVSLRDRGEVYSDRYTDLISSEKAAVTALAENAAQLRYDRIVSDAQDEVDKARKKLDQASGELSAKKSAAIEDAAEQIAAAGQVATPENPYYAQLIAGIDEAFADAERELEEGRAELEAAQREVDSIEAPSVYVMTRAENPGYAAFGQDSTIIENISVVFPVFFFLVAALVCVTTMTRMIEEQRTQIGVLKALGYGKGKICLKYVFYAGSAGMIGSVLGFFAGTALIPMTFWYAYRALYNFADRLLYSFDPVMYALSLAISMLCTAGVTLLCCRNVLREVPAVILRPKTPKDGKRILIERFRFWRHVSFLHKVSLRNVIRYKQRFFLMILGISGCTALLLTGFGIRDSIQNVTEYQYGEITLYDAEITFTGTMDGERKEAFVSRHDGIEDALFLSVCNADITSDSATGTVSVMAVPDGNALSGFIDLHSGDDPVAYPPEGGAVLCRGIAEKLSAKPGDTLMLTDDSLRQIAVTVTGICDNYIGNYVVIPEKDMARLHGDAPLNTAYVRFAKDTDVNPAELNGDADVSHVSLTGDTQETIESSFASLNLVVLLIILCAGMLAFIVLFNLININIGERIREIATIRVLGFFNSEASSYVFREVNMLTAAGTLAGLLLGHFLHSFVMAQIRPEGICFDCRIMWYSYLFSIAATLVFAILVQLVMQIRLRGISMTQSLKSVE